MNTNNGQDVTEETVEDLSALDQPAENVEGELPESVKEQTKEQFEKLKAHNKELSEKLSKLEAERQPQYQSVLDELPAQSQAFQNLSTTQVEDIASGLVDRDGYIDQDLLNKTLREANAKAKRAEDRAMLAEQRIEKFEETQIVRDVHSKHPTLDPYNQNFDRNFYDAVKKEIQGQLQRGYQDFKAAADKVAAELKARSVDSQAQQKAKEEEQKKVLAQRELANPAGSRKGFQPGQYEDLEEGTRKGDTLSIGQLLQANGY